MELGAILKSEEISSSFLLVMDNVASHHRQENLDGSYLLGTNRQLVPLSRMIETSLNFLAHYAQRNSRQL